MIVKDLASQKPEDQREEWERVLESWASYSAEGRIGEHRFKSLVECVEDPKKFELLMRSFQSFWNHSPQENPGLILFREVDDSSYSLKDWLDSIFYFYNWLHERERGSDFKSMLGYISCCIEGVDSGANRPELVQVLEQMLETHGFLGKY